MKRLRAHCFEERGGQFVRCAIQDLTDMDMFTIWNFYNLQNLLGRVVIEEEVDLEDPKQMDERMYF